MKYQLRGEYKRRENGVFIEPNGITELKHLDDKAIKLLLQIGIYKEVKTAKKGDK